MNPQDDIDDAYKRGHADGLRTSTWADTHRIKKAPKLIDDIATGLKTFANGMGTCNLQVFEAVLLEDGKEIYATDVPTMLEHLINDLWYGVEHDISNADSARVRSF